MSLLKSCSLLLLFAWSLGSCADAAPLAQVVRHAPLLKPQPDGVLSLNVEAAALVKWNGTEPTLINNGGGVLQPLKGSIDDWNSDRETPCWRIKLPKAGRYEVVINHATNIDRQSTAKISFFGATEHSITSRVESTGGWDIFAPSVLGEVDLDAGESIVEFRPVAWTSSLWIIKLADIRLIPLNRAQESAAAQALLNRLGVNAKPAVAALKRRHEESLRHLDALLQATANRDFGTYTDYHQFFQYDAAAARLADAQDRERELARKLELLQEAMMKKSENGKQLSRSDRQRLTAYFAAENTLFEGATRAYPKVDYPEAVVPRQETGITASGRAPLFPTGNLNKLPRQQIDTTLPTYSLSLTPPPDASDRMARFRARDSNEGVAALCRQFNAAIHAEIPGLEAFKRLYQAGRYREALDAYRTYFFAKLADPEKYGAVTENIRFDRVRDIGKGEILFKPNPIVLDDNLHNRAVGEIGGRVVVGEVGPPGAVWWAPSDLGQPLSGDDGELKREFFRRLTFLPDDATEYFQEGLFPALLFSYTSTGNRTQLQRWSDYVDDWTMNAKRDEDNCAWTPRRATELEPQEVRALFTLMRIILDERPAFAHDFDSATLARLLLKINEDYAPYLIRAQRTEIAGWGIVGLGEEMNAARFLQEFRASDYFGRETWRLWNMNDIQHTTLDGANAEAWDTGHDRIAFDFVDDSVPFAKLPPGTSPLEVTRFWDQMKVGMRDMLIHISPAGFYWPPWTTRVDFVHNDLRNRWMKSFTPGRFNIDLVAKEPEARRRIDTILNGGKAGSAGPPEHYSDLEPYASMAYLRDSWQPTADYLIMQNFIDRSQAVSDCARSMYDLSAGGRTIFEGHSLTVDGKADNRYYGKLRTGGKTAFCGEAGRHVVADRFYTSARFDLAEATQDAPYARQRTGSYGEDLYHIYRPTANGLDDPAPITDVIDHRQVFHVRGTGVWIVSDRIENKGAQSHAYAQFLTLPVRLPEEGLADRVRLLQAAKYPLIEQAGHHIRTANPGFENVSAYFVSPQPLTFANRQTSPGQYETFPTSPLDQLAADLAGGRTPAQVAEADGKRPYAVAWSGAGNQNLVSVLYSRPAATTLEQPFANDLASFEEVHAAQGVTGCHLTTPQGVEIWFENGPQLTNALTCGPLTAQAEALLVVREKGQTRGLLLGGKSIAGQSSLGTPDAEFALDAQGAFSESAPIRRPIDTVQISPENEVFTDQAQVSFSIPTQDTSDIEYHYTLDGSDPTLRSPLYTGPFPISATTLVKVRPFRKGLKTTPWTDTGTDSGMTMSALYRKQAALPAIQETNLQPGLDFRYYEDTWTRLFTYAGSDGVLQPKTTGHVAALLDPAETEALRQTDRAYAVRYDGYLKVPATGVYAFYAPAGLYDTTMDAGYDLRVFIDGREWYPNPAVHAENIWNIALGQGLHTLSVAYVDYRWKTFRDEYWMNWQPEEMGQGTPTLDISGPNLARTALPTAWLFRK